jgi:molybdate transport system substrate-binding protein
MALLIRIHLLALSLLLILATPVFAADALVVFAAASLTDSLDEVIAAFRHSHNLEIKVSYAGSLMLARQIEQGASADILITADAESMNYAAEKNLINARSRFDLISNELVVVAPASSSLSTLVLSQADITAALGNGRLATGDVQTVPVGKYAKQAFENMGLWGFVGQRLSLSDNVRAALAFVARGEAPLGVVYATDAAIEPKVKIVAQFPARSHAPIIYPAALTAQSHSAPAQDFLNFLRSDDAQHIFMRFGFSAASY